MKNYVIEHEPIYSADMIVKKFELPNDYILIGLDHNNLKIYLRPFDIENFEYYDYSSYFKITDLVTINQSIIYFLDAKSNEIIRRHPAIIDIEDQIHNNDKVKIFLDEVEQIHYKPKKLIYYKLSEDDAMYLKLLQ